MVTSGPISLGIDAIHFNIPWIMNFSDKSRVLYNGGALFTQGGKSNCTPEHVLKLDIGVPYAKKYVDEGVYGDETEAMIEKGIYLDCCGK